MATNLIIPEKNDPVEQFETPLDVGADGIAAAGFYPQASGTASNAATQTVGIERDPGNNLVLKDPNAGTKTLSDLVNSATSYDFLLESDPPSPNNVYFVTYAGAQPTKETWKRSSDNSILKTIDYTYSAGKVNQEVRKVFAADGSTVVAQLTLVYNYPGGLAVEISGTRNV